MGKMALISLRRSPPTVDQFLLLVGLERSLVIFSFPFPSTSFHILSYIHPPTLNHSLNTTPTHTPPTPSPSACGLGSFRTCALSLTKGSTAVVLKIHQASCACGMGSFRAWALSLTKGSTPVAAVLKTHQASCSCSMGNLRAWALSLTKGSMPVAAVLKNSPSHHRANIRVYPLAKY